MKFVIPSFQRPQQLKDQTISYLASQHVDPKDIYIFVRSDDDKLNEYLELRNEDVNVEVSVGVFGIGKTHNYITEYFDEDDFIIEIDDDLICLKDKEKNDVDLLEVINEMKEIMDNKKINYGGLYQCDNNMFMSKCEHYTYDLRYMLGLFRLRRIKKDIILETNYAEDMENCLLHFKRDGMILKNNWLCGKTKNYADGGCCADGRNLETEKKDKEYLHKKFPQYTRLFTRKNGHTDLRLREYK